MHANPTIPEQPFVSPAATSVRRGPPQARAELGAPRVDLYTLPHKGLRILLTNLLTAMGQATFSDASDVGPLLEDLDRALWACDTHIEHEDAHIPRERPLEPPKPPGGGIARHPRVDDFPLEPGRRQPPLEQCRIRLLG